MRNLVDGNHEQTTKVHENLFAINIEVSAVAVAPTTENDRTVVTNIIVVNSNNTNDNNNNNNDNNNQLQRWYHQLKPYENKSGNLFFLQFSQTIISLCLFIVQILFLFTFFFSFPLKNASIFNI